MVGEIVCPTGQCRLRQAAVDGRRELPEPGQRPAARERAAAYPGTGLPSLIAEAHIEEWLSRKRDNEYLEQPEVGRPVLAWRVHAHRLLGLGRVLA